VKKILVLLGIVISLAIIVVFGIKLFMQHKASQYEETAVPYIKMVIPEISKWDPQIIKKYMPAASLAQTSDEKIINITQHLSKLGALKKMHQPSFSSEDLDVKIAGVKNTIISYEINAEYENGDAVITLGLQKEGSTYRVHNFKINSSVLTE